MKENKLIVIVAVYNAIYNDVNHIENCLRSIAQQTYKNYEVVVVDDCSTDGTWETIQQYPFHTIRNAVHDCCGFANQLKAIRYLEVGAEDVYVTVDGDDYLIDDTVFEYVNSMYQDRTLLTYGRFNYMSGYEKEVGLFPAHLNMARYRRNDLFKTSHLKTFKKKLFDRIQDKDFRGSDGNYYKVIGDQPLMYPMIEMAGRTRIKCADRALYVYNDTHSGTPHYDIFQVEEKRIRRQPNYALWR